MVRFAPETHAANVLEPLAPQLASDVAGFNNHRGIFSNTGDDLVGLESVLSEHLEEPSVRIRGCVALFAGKMG